MGKVDRLNSRPQPVPLDTAAIMEKQEDRRLRGDRLHVSFRVFMSYQGQLIQGYAEARNLSWSGMLLATNFPLNLGDRVQLEFTLPNTDVPASVKAKVIHRLPEATPEDATELGVVFEEVEPNIQRMIAGFVLENLQHE